MYHFINPVIPKKKTGECCNTLEIASQPCIRLLSFKSNSRSLLASYLYSTFKFEHAWRAITIFIYPLIEAHFHQGKGNVFCCIISNVIAIQLMLKLYSRYFTNHCCTLSLEVIITQVKLLELCTLTKYTPVSTQFCCSCVNYQMFSMLLDI